MSNRAVNAKVHVLPIESEAETESAWTEIEGPFQGRGHIQNSSTIFLHTHEPYIYAEDCILYFLKYSLGLELNTSQLIHPN